MHPQLTAQPAGGQPDAPSSLRDPAPDRLGGLHPAKRGDLLEDEQPDSLRSMSVIRRSHGQQQSGVRLQGKDRA